MCGEAKGANFNSQDSRACGEKGAECGSARGPKTLQVSLIVEDFGEAGGEGSSRKEDPVAGGVREVFRTVHGLGLRILKMN